MNKLCLLFAILLTLSGSSQTSVGGGIYSNTNWSLAGSPYIVTSSTTIFPGVTLTIAPGVIVKFADSVKMEVRGNLVATGSQTDSIKFQSSNLSPYPGIWTGIYINNQAGGVANIQYSNFRYADIAFNVTSYTANAPIKVAHSTFNQNRVGINGSCAPKVPVDSCMFISNTWGVAGANMVIRASGFLNNQYGICWGQIIDVYDSWFCGNNVGLLGGQGELQNNIIMNNTEGVQPNNGGFYNVTGNTISENGIGITVDGSFGATNPIGVNNKICNNITYDVVNGYASNVSIPNNCWCTTDSAGISLKIYDGYDDINRGLVSFTPVIICDSSILPAKPCSSTPVNNVKKYITSQIDVYPNPVMEKTMISCAEPFIEVKLTDMLGKDIKVIDFIVPHNRETLDLANVENGIYSLMVSNRKQHVFRKIIVQH